MSNKPNSPRFWAGNGGGVKNKANRRGRDGLGIDYGLGIIDDFGLGTPRDERRADREHRMQNKPNFLRFSPGKAGGRRNKANPAGRGGPPIDYELGIIDDLGAREAGRSQIVGASRQTKPIWVS
jgi:hypothetical protein